MDKSSLEQSNELMILEGKKILEALFFASNTPLSIKKIHDILSTLIPFSLQEVTHIVYSFRDDLKETGRPLTLEEVADGFILKTAPTYLPYIQLLIQDRKGEKLSQAGREVLAIVAYKGGVTRQEIDTIRGVDSSGTLQILIEKDLVEVKGKLEAPGRPSLYGVTEKFLYHFGLKNTQELVQAEPSSKTSPPLIQYN